jgi:adenylate cyclase 10
MKADALIIKNRVFQSEFERIKKQAIMFVPKALLPYIEIDQEPWSSELRRMTVVFVNLEIDLRDAEKEPGLAKI